MPLREPFPDGDPAWKEVLRGASPREVLTKLIQGDPLRLRQRCEERLESQALLLDAQRLHLRALAHTARRAPAYGGVPSIDVWLAERIRDSVRELLREDDEAVQSGPLPEATLDPRLLAVARTLGIEPEAMRRGVAAFNRAAFEVRAAFQGLVVEGRSPAEWAARNGSTPARAKAAARRGLWILGVRDPSDLDELQAEGDDDL